MPNIAVLIVAAGSSARMGGATPKPYMLLHGTPLLRHSAEAFLAHPEVTSVRVVIHPDHRAFYDKATEGLALARPVIGGASRQESVLHGLTALQEEAPDYVLIHDAARPLVDAALISRVVAALADYAAVIPVLPVTDTIKQVTEGEVVATPERAALAAAQTPQGFHYQKIFAAHRQWAGRELTDDAAVAEAAGTKVAVVAGSPENSKFTTPSDWQNFQHCHTISAMGFDVHRLIESDKPLKLCGVTIESPLALDGHSDADVALHALTDALLGSISAGDIGQHFPPSDAKWKDCDSEVFVRHALSLLQAARARLVHLDLTLICEVPKIAPHREVMRQRVSDLLAIDISHVSVKATTTEGLGFAGRGEGIAAQCVVSVEVAQ